MKRIVLSSLLIAGLAACSSAPVKETEAVKVEDKSATSATKSATPDSRSATQSTVAVNPLKDPGSILSKRNVFFDFDEYVVKDEFKPLVQAHAKYLGQNGAKVTVLGNTDERGSREYNLALGQRRADAVKKAMTILGANDKQIETVSYGEEKAKCSQAEESCWAQNRRADLVYPGEQ